MELNQSNPNNRIQSGIDDWVALFELLIKIDKKNKPHLYVEKE